MNKKISKFCTLFCAAMLLSVAVSSTHANPGYNQLINRIFSRVQPQQRQDWLVRLGELAKKMGVKATGRVDNEVATGACAKRSSGQVVISKRYLDLPKSQLDFVLAHELGHLKQPLSQWIPFLLQRVSLSFGVSSVAMSIMHGKVPGFRKLFGNLVISLLIHTWGMRTNEYDADARAVRALQSTEGAILHMGYPLNRDVVGLVATGILIALPLDWSLEKVITKYLERTFMAGYEELSEKNKKFRDRMLRVTKVASRCLSILVSLQLGGMITIRLAKRNLTFNCRTHPTPQQRIDALRRLNLG